MMVELNNEAVDEIVKSILVQDYKNLCSDISRLEESQQLAEYQKQDLEHNYRYLNAMETMMEYYIGFDWKQEL